MDKDSIVNGVRTLGPWFHRIELPHGLVTKTEGYCGELANHPLDTWEYVSKCLPVDLSGKRVLDIGCNGGFYAIESRRREASQVLGVDANRWHVRQARFVSQALGLDRMEFKRMSVYKLDRKEIGDFDVVLALGLVYHLKHPIYGLERIYSVTKDLLILESAVIPPEISDSPKDLRFGIEDKKFYPLMYVKNNPELNEAPNNWFIPTADTIEAMLLDVGFVDVKQHPIHGGRALLTAYKREVQATSLCPAGLRADLTISSCPKRVRGGEEVCLTLHARNSGTVRWLAQGKGENERGAVGIFGYLLPPNEGVFGLELPRLRIHKDVLPGEEVIFNYKFQIPKQPGCYQLELDLVSEHVTLFQDGGSRPLFLELEVIGD